MNPFGPNALAQFIDDRLGFIDFIANDKPAACLIMDGSEVAQSVKKLLPQSLIIHRTYNSNDSHWQDVITPDEWLNIHRPFAANGVVLQVFNEPSPGDLGTFLNWLITLMDLATSQGIILAVGNFAVGNPDQKLIANGSFDPLLKKLSTSKHILALHEYFKTDPVSEAPYLCGRFKFWLDRADALGIARPKIVITEHGRDFGGGQNDGWRGQGWSEEQYFALLLKAQTLYQPYNIPVCIFCYGHGAGNRWSSFDIQQAQTLKSKLITYGASMQLSFPDPSTLGAILTGTVTKTSDPSGANVRQQPSVNSSIVGIVKVGDSVQHRAKTYNDGSYAPWTYLEDRKGWVASVAIIRDDVPPAAKMVAKFPYVSQLGNKTNNDCWIADVVMWTQYELAMMEYGSMPLITVNNLIPLTALATSDQPYPESEVMKLLQLCGLKTAKFRSDLTPQVIAAEIDKLQPPILLGNYKYIQPGSKAFGHWFVVVGYAAAPDGLQGFFINDPYNMGEHYYMNLSDFTQCISDVSGFASVPYQGFSF